MSRLVVVCCLLATSAWAQSRSVDGWGRVTLQGGWRWVPNWYFADRAAQAGAPLVRASPGGPQGSASFGYGVLDFIELSVDLFAGFETVELQGRAPFTSTTYGALLGPRLTKHDLLFPGFAPYVGVQLGPVLTMLFSSEQTVPEQLLATIAVNGGLTYRFNPRWAVTLDVRWLLARTYVPDIAGINVGGLWFSAGVTLFFPPEPKRDLDIPGF